MDQDTYKAFQVESPYVGKYLRVRFSYYSGLCFFYYHQKSKKCSDVTFSEKTNNGKNFHLNQSLGIDLVLFRHLDSLVSFDSIREI